MTQVPCQMHAEIVQTIQEMEEMERAFVLLDNK